MKIIFNLFLLFLIFSCAKEKVGGDIDQQLFEMASSSTNEFTYYKKSSAFLDKSSGSGHNFAYLKTKYNTEAATMLDSTGKIIENASFPEGSLIVKELYNANKDLERYAILYKKSTHEFADQNGWVWGYINSNESVSVKASDKGAQCINCHTQSGHIDYMLMNKFFP